MKFKQIIPYKIRRALSMAAIAGAPLLPTASCNKIEPEQHDVEIEFNDIDVEKILTFETLQNYANDKTIKTIYLVPTKHWNGLAAHNITYFRNKFLQPRLNISSKIRGRGDFDFALGEASKVPNDSLWFVQQGWTINKKYQK